MTHPMLSDPALADLPYGYWCEPDPTLVSAHDTADPFRGMSRGAVGAYEWRAMRHHLACNIRNNWERKYGFIPPEPTPLMSVELAASFGCVTPDVASGMANAPVRACPEWVRCGACRGAGRIDFDRPSWDGRGTPCSFCRGTGTLNAATGDPL